MRTVHTDSEQAFIDRLGLDPSPAAESRPARYRRGPLAVQPHDPHGEPMSPRAANQLGKLFASINSRHQDKGPSR